MKYIARIFIGVFLLALSIAPAASAQPVTLAWTAPTTCSDGTAIGTATCPAITSYKVYCAASAAGVPAAAPVEMGAAMSRTWDIATSQTVYCGVTATNAGGTSAMSNIVSKTVAIPTAPGAPGCAFQ